MQNGLRVVVGSVGRLTWPRLNMSKIAELAQGQRVEVLRIDAQGTELGFLRSIRSATAAGRVRFIVAFAYHEATSGFATTHADCLAEIACQDRNNKNGIAGSVGGDDLP